MNVSRLKVVILVSAVGILAVFTQTVNRTPSQPAIPPDVVWQLDYVLVQGQRTQPFLDTPKVQFVSETTFIGHDGCNSFCVVKQPAKNSSRETISVSHTLLSCSAIITTVAISENREERKVAEVTKPEEDFMNDLLAVAKYKVHEDELRLYYPGDGSKVMIFHPATEPFDASHVICPDD